MQRSKEQIPVGPVGYLDKFLQGRVQLTHVLFFLTGHSCEIIIRGKIYVFNRIFVVSNLQTCGVPEKRHTNLRKIKESRTKMRSY